MKPVVYSKKKAQEANIGWHRAGNGISYFPNEILKSTKHMYTLQFSYTFKYTNDTVWFAYNYPYTYTQLKEYLDSLELKKAEYYV
jgi:hypothetical protein